MWRDLLFSYFKQNMNYKKHNIARELVDIII